MGTSDVTYGSLRDAHILVTGAGSGIGRACVDALLAQGCRVSASDIDLSRYATTAEPPSGGLALDRVDVTDGEAVDAWVRTRREEWGTIAGLVCSAGIESDSDSDVAGLDPDVWERTLSVNLGGMYRTTGPVVRHAIADGAPMSVVLIGSPTGYYGMEVGKHAYSASKGGVLGLGRVMANEYAGIGIRVNVVWPGLIETPLNAFLYDDPMRLDNEISQIPLRRMGQPDEVAAMTAFLLSDQAAYCTGGIYAVDGGLTAV